MDDQNRIKFNGVNLFIDTSGYDSARFAFARGREFFIGETHLARQENWKILNHLDFFLKKHKVKKSDIKKITVCKGPGSYTGTRVGVTIAQALSLALNVPLRVVGKAAMDKIFQNKNRLVK